MAQNSSFFPGPEYLLLLGFNPSALCRLRMILALSTLYHSWYRVCLSAEGAKTFSWFWPSPLRGWSTLTMTFIGNFAHIYSSPLYLATAQSQCLMTIESYDGLNTLWHSYGFACQQRVLKMFYCPDYEQNNQKLHFDGKWYRHRYRYI